MMSSFYRLGRALGAVGLLPLFAMATHAQSSAFTYQGALNDAGAPASGSYDFEFSLYDVPTAGAPLGAAVTSSGVPVSNGVFTVALDFGSAVFSGEDRWLQIAVRTNGAATFSPLDPRQALTATPYAVRSGVAAQAASVAAANITGTVALGQLPGSLVTNGASGVSLSGTLSGTFSGSGAALTGLNPYSLLGASSAPSGAPFVIANLPETVIGNTLGQAYGSAIAGNYLYLANGYNDGFRVLDVSNPANPRLLGYIPSNYMGSGSPTKVAVSGNYAYLANGYDGFRVINIADPANPVAVGHVDTGFVSGQGVAISGTNAFLANYSAGLRIINVSNPTNPVVTANVFGIGTAWDVAVAGSYACVATSLGFYVVNVSDPAAPLVQASLSQTVLGKGNGSGYGYGVAVSGNFAYVADSAFFAIVDISNPGAPTLVNSFFYSNFGGGSVLGVAVSGNLVYLTCSTGLYVLNVANPVTPTLTGVVPRTAMNNGSPNHITLAAPYAYLASTATYSPPAPGGLSVLGISTILAGDGSQLTKLNATNLTGTLSLARLPTAVVTNNQTGVVLGGTFSGNGSGLTNLNAATLTGTVPAGQLPASFSGTFSGNGAGLTNLGAANLTGTLAPAQLPANVLTNTQANVTLSGTFGGNGTIPIGGIIMWNSMVAPAGWAVCDGANGTPDLRGRFVLGSGNGVALTPRVSGQVGGAESKTLSVAEIPAHSHGLSVPTVGYSASYNTGTEATGAPGGNRNNGTQGFGTGNTGGGAAFSILPPYYVLTYIMRIQ